MKSRGAAALSDGLGLPHTRHVPGSGTAPDRLRLGALLRAGAPGLAPDLAAGRTPAAVTDGCALYRAGYFWEAHEVWEPVWAACTPNGRERCVVEALIALANACLKLEMGRPRAAARLLAHAREGLTGDAGGPVFGLDPAALDAAVAAFEARLAGAPDGAGGALLAARPAVLR